MRYIFDISDTGGKNVKLTWDLEGENLKKLCRLSGIGRTDGAV